MINRALINGRQQWRVRIRCCPFFPGGGENGQLGRRSGMYATRPARLAALAPLSLFDEQERAAWAPKLVGLVGETNGERKRDGSSQQTIPSSDRPS